MQLIRLRDEIISLSTPKGQACLFLSIKVVLYSPISDFSVRMHIPACVASIWLLLVSL